MLRSISLPTITNWNVSEVLATARTHWRSHVAAFCMSTAGLIQLTEFDFGSPMLLILWALITAGIIVAAGMDIEVKSLRSFKICLWVIVICGWIAIPVSFLTHGGLPQTVSLAMFLFPMLLYYRYGQYQQLERVMTWMIPGLFIHAGWAFFTAFVLHQTRVQGLSTNQNAGSGIIAFGIIYFASHPKLKWLTPPLLMVLPFFGSRWVTVITVLMVILIFASRYVPWKWLFVGMAAALIFSFTTNLEIINDSYRITGRVARDHQNDAVTRMFPQKGDGTMWRDLLIPSGFSDTFIHSLPVRLSTEFGIYTGIAFVTLGGMAIWRKPRFTPAWWMVLMSLGFSVMYYHTWVGPIAMFWWLPLGERHSEIANEKD